MHIKKVTRMPGRALQWPEDFTWDYITSNLPDSLFNLLRLMVTLFKEAL
jgi:hypothetical protein